MSRDGISESPAPQAATNHIRAFSTFAAHFTKFAVNTGNTGNEACPLATVLSRETVGGNTGGTVSYSASSRYEFVPPHTLHDPDEKEEKSLKPAEESKEYDEQAEPDFVESLEASDVHHPPFSPAQVRTRHTSSQLISSPSVENEPHFPPENAGPKNEECQKNSNIEASARSSPIPYTDVSATESQSGTGHPGDHGMLKGTDLETGTALDGRSSWNYEPPLLGSDSVEYRQLKGQIDGGDIPNLTLEGVGAEVKPEEIFQRLHQIFSDCPLYMRVNVVSKSETLDGVSNAAPEFMINSGADNPTITLESGQFRTVRHLCKILEANLDVAIFKFRHILLETKDGLRHYPPCLNHITHLDLFDMQFEPVDIIAYLLRCMPSLRACSLRAVFIRFKCENGIPSCFTEHDRLKLSEILVHGRDAHSMGELAKLLFRPVGSNKRVSLFDKSTVEKLELCGPGWGAADAAKPYLFKVVYDRGAPTFQLHQVHT